MVVAVENEGEIGLGCRGQFAVVAKPRIFELGLGVVPFGGIRRIGHHGVKIPGAVDAPGVRAVGPVPFQGVGVAQGHVAVGDTVHHQIHPGEVEGGGVQLLTKVFNRAGLSALGQFVSHGEQQGAGALSCQANDNNYING